MKKIDFKSIIVGLVAGVIVASGISVASTLVTGDVYFSSFPIYVNGSYYTTSSSLLNYNGRTYVPLNELGTMLGANVNFANNTIYLSTNNNYSGNYYNDNYYNNSYYNDRYYGNTKTYEEDLDVEVNDSEEYYVSLARYGARSASITTSNSNVKLNKTSFSNSGDLKITGKKEGNTTVKITYNTGDVEKLYVKVYEDDDDYEEDIEMETGDAKKIYIDLDDYDADSATISYDSDYIKVSKTKFTSDGYLTITAKDEGHTTLKIKYDTGDVDYYYIEIDDDGDYLDDNYDEIEVEEGDYEYVYIDLDDYDATSATLTYNSSYIKLNKTTLTENGKVKVTGRSEGYTSIKVKFNTGGVVYIDVEVVD